MIRKTALALAVLALPAAAVAQAPPPAPTPDQVKACVQQMDLAKQWTFDWKTIQVGQARHPQNAYERAGLRGDADFGYPVHVTYVFNHATTIDADYWMTHDAQNNWWIVAVCRPRR
jgi:hypothetical protein